MNTNKLIKVLRSLKLDGWSMIVQRQERSTLHLAKQDVETSIDAVREQAEITIYKDYGKKQGDSKFTLFTDDEATIKQRVKEALMICSTAKKQSWPLPKKQDYPDVQTSDPVIVKAFSAGKAEQLTLKFWKQMANAARTERSTVLNHAELHLTQTRNLVANSQGLRGESSHTELFVEAIMTAKKGKNEDEFHNAITVGRIKEFSAATFIKETAQAARDVLAAEDWQGVQDQGIILSGCALRDFWAPDLVQSPIVAHANAQAKHRQLSVFAKGKRVTRNERFTLTSNPFLPYNPASGRFDAEGTASRKIVLVEHGVCSGFVASQRFAHYLEVEPTGALGVIQVATGNEPSAGLRKGDVVEVVSFSSFVPNGLSGDFSAEIRLGYRFEGNRKLPVKRAMFTGNVFRMLDAMRASKEGMTMARYAGPGVMRFDAGAHLAGVSAPSRPRAR